MAASAYSFLRVMVQTRSRGHTASGAAAYRFGEKMESLFAGDDGQPREYDYTKRRGLGPRGCALSEGAGESWRDLRTWCHRIEKIDTRKDARQCRDSVVAIPYELRDQAEAVMGRFSQRIAEDEGTPVHWIVHDIETDNPHGHALYAGRRLDGADAFAKKRDTRQDQKSGRGRQSIVDRHRAIWIEVCREFGVEIDFAPKGARAQKHIGPRAWHQERKAIEQEQGIAIRAALDSGIASDDLREAAAAAIEGLSVTEALTLNRHPTTESVLEAPKPRTAAPDVELPPPRREAAPGIELDPPQRTPAPDVELSPPLDLARSDVELDPPRRTAAPDIELPPPLDPARPDVELEPPRRIATPDVELDPPRRTAAPDVKLDTPRHITEAKARKRRETEARQTLEEAITSDTAATAAEALIRNHAGDASAFATFYGVGRQTSKAAVTELRPLLKRHNVAERDRRQKARTTRQYLGAVERVIDGFRRWWNAGGGMFGGGEHRGQGIARQIIAAVWPTHLRETEEEERRIEAQIRAKEESERRRREQQEQALFRQQLAQTTQSPQRKPGQGQQGGGPER